MTIFFTESTRSVPSLPSEDTSWAKAIGQEKRTNRMPANRVLASTHLWRREAQMRGGTAKSRGRESKEKRSFFIRWFRFYGCVVCVLMEIAYSTTNIKKTTPTPTRDCCRESCSLFVALRHRTPSSPISPFRSDTQALHLVASILLIQRKEKRHSHEEKSAFT